MRDSPRHPGVKTLSTACPSIGRNGHTDDNSELLPRAAGTEGAQESVGTLVHG